MKKIVAVLSIAVALAAVLTIAPAEAVTTNTLSSTAFANITIPASYSNATPVWFSQPTGATAIWVTAKSVAGSIKVQPTKRSLGLNIGDHNTGGTNYSATSWVTISATSTYSFVCPDGTFMIDNDTGADQVIDIGF